MTISRQHCFTVFTCGGKQRNRVTWKYGVRRVAKTSLNMTDLVRHKTSITTSKIQMIWVYYWFYFTLLFRLTCSKMWSCFCSNAWFIASLSIIFWSAFIKFQINNFMRYLSFVVVIFMDITRHTIMHYI